MFAQQGYRLYIICAAGGCRIRWDLATCRSRSMFGFISCVPRRNIVQCIEEEFEEVISDRASLFFLAA